MTRLPMYGALVAVALVVMIAGTALATPAIQPFTPTFLSKSVLSESVQFNTGAIKFQTKEPVRFVVQTVTIGPGGSSGWHSHPGVVLVSITSGAMRHYAADCSFEPLTAGQAFVESGSHAGLVQNVGSVDLVVHATFVVPAATTDAQLRHNEDNPGCDGIN